MLGLGLACLLAMSSSEEDDTVAIQRAQRRRQGLRPPRRRLLMLPTLRRLFPWRRTDWCAELSKGTVDGVSTGAPRTTCMKEKLAVKCPHCSNRLADREACAYKTGGNGTRLHTNDTAAAAPAERQTVAADMAESVPLGEG